MHPLQIIIYAIFYLLNLNAPCCAFITLCTSRSGKVGKVYASIALWLEPRPSDSAVVGSSPGLGGYMCLPY